MRKLLAQLPKKITYCSFIIFGNGSFCQPITLDGYDIYDGLIVCRTLFYLTLRAFIYIFGGAQKIRKLINEVCTFIKCVISVEFSYIIKTSYDGIVLY